MFLLSLPLGDELYRTELNNLAENMIRVYSYHIAKESPNITQTFNVCNSSITHTLLFYLLFMMKQQNH